MGLPLGSSPESTNPVAGMPGTLVGATLELWFGSETFRCQCCFRRLTDFRKYNCWGVCISCIPPSRALITSTMISVRYYQLLGFLTLEISPTWLVPYSGGEWRASELASYGFIPFKLVMDKYSYILTAKLSGCYNLLGILVDWDSPSLGV